MRMMGRLVAGIVVLAGIFLLVSCGREAELPPLGSGAVILAFGDSLTAGNGAPADGNYPAQLERLVNRTVINAGISGEMSGEGVSRLGGLLDEHSPQLLILCHGGNDLLRRSSMAELDSNLREMIAMAQAREIPVVMLGVPAPGIFLSGADVYEAVAEDTGVILLPDVIADVLSHPSMKSDTVHPNEAGYGEIAAAVFAELKERGAI